MPLMEFAKESVSAFLKKHNVTDIVFVPYAIEESGFEKYTAKMAAPFENIGLKVRGIQTFPSPKEALEKAHCVFVGGGNTFRLLKRLYDEDLVELIRKRVMDGSLVYMGSSAGSNVSTVSIHVTNDMPIVYPPTFDAINLVPFNINPHYVDPDPNSTHMGETRVKRIKEFLEMGYGTKVVGLYEGSFIEIEGNRGTLKGRGAKLFVEGSDDAKEKLEDGADISFLLE